MHPRESIVSGKTQSGITVTLALSMLLASLGTSIANVALPILAKAFAAPFSQVQAVTVAYLAALTISVVIAGRLGDRHGLKTMLLSGLGMFLGASLFCAAAPGLWWLIGARALQGVGAAFLMTIPMALMRQTAEGARLGRAMGLLGTMSALGTTLGSSLGGMVIPVLGWRGIFWIQVPLAASALVLAHATLPEDPRREKAPVANMWAAIDWRIAPNLFVNLLVAAVMMTKLVVGPFYLSYALGLREATIGMVMAVGPLISTP